MINSGYGVKLLISKLSGNNRGLHTLTNYLLSKHNTDLFAEYFAVHILFIYDTK